MGHISRNAPCPCGSGKKYKQCCEGKGIPWSKRLRIPGVLTLMGIVAGVVTSTRAELNIGLAVGAVGFLAGVGWLILSNPPPPSGRSSDSSAINFGK